MTCEKCKANKVCDHNLWGFETCDNFIPINTTERGYWKYYSTTMMECNACGRHTARHRFEFCPHCGSSMTLLKAQLKQDSQEDWQQLSLFDPHTGGHSQ